jgi:hypothetical protein
MGNASQRPPTVLEKKGMLHVTYGGLLFVCGVAGVLAYVEGWFGNHSLWPIALGLGFLIATIHFCLSGVRLLVKRLDQ